MIPIQRIVCATDAEIVLYQIQGESKTYKKFVENQVGKIRNMVPVKCWVHVPRKHNPADLPSRGCYPSQLKNESTVKFYVNGPEWMKDEMESWPVRKNVKLTLEDRKAAEEKISDAQTECLMTTVSSATNLREVVEFERYGSLDRLLRVVAWCRRFIHNCRRRIEEKAVTGELMAEECDQARLL